MLIVKFSLKLMQQFCDNPNTVPLIKPTWDRTILGLLTREQIFATLMCVNEYGWL